MNAIIDDDFDLSFKDLELLHLQESQFFNSNSNSDFSFDAPKPLPQPVVLPSQLLDETIQKLEQLKLEKLCREGEIAMLRQKLLQVKLTLANHHKMLFRSNKRNLKWLRREHFDFMK